MTGPHILRTKEEIERANYYAARFEEIERTATPDMLQCIPAGLNKTTIAPLMGNVDMLVAKIGPRLLTLLASQALNEMVKNGIGAKDPGSVRAMEGWSVVLGMLANDSTMAPVLYEQIMNAAASDAIAEMDQGKPKLDS